MRLSVSLRPTLLHFGSTRSLEYSQWLSLWILKHTHRCFRNMTRLHPPRQMLLRGSNRRAFNLEQERLNKLHRTKHQKKHEDGHGGWFLGFCLLGWCCSWWITFPLRGSSSLHHKRPTLNGSQMVSVKSRHQLTYTR